MDVVSSYYWSSTTDDYGIEGAFRVDFDGGGVYGYGKWDSYYVRAVRAGQ
jgi:hypothetical protein